MRGSLVQRSAGSWTIILDLGYTAVDPATGRRKRRQKWITIRGTRRQAEKKLADLLSEYNHGTFIEPSKRTVAEWLTEWLGKAIQPPMRTSRAYATYHQVVTGHLVPAVGPIRLQALT